MPTRVKLHMHPDCRSALQSLEVGIVRLAPRRILLRFFLGKGADHILWPHADEAPRRLDEMWLHTCLEAFVRADGEASYYEVNLLPSLHWAAYRFSDYRTGMKMAKDVDAPRLEPDSYDGPPDYAFSLTLEMARAVALPVDRPWHLGLSAVIEEKNGRKSYWALAHPPGKPDFHHPDCFALELPAASAP
jgi:hypothetical protein